MLKGLLVIKPSKTTVELLSFIDDNINSLKKIIQINLVVHKPSNKKIDKLLSKKNITHLPVLFIDEHVIIGCTKIRSILQKMISTSPSKGELEEEENDYSSYIKGTGMLNPKKKYEEEDEAEKTKKELDTIMVNYAEEQNKKNPQKKQSVENKKVEDPMGHGETQDLTSEDAITEQHNKMLVNNWSEDS